KYLGKGNWHKAALDPSKAMNGLAAYDRDLLAQANGDLKKAAAMYNGGPHPNSQAQAYGSAVGGVAQGIYGSLDVTVTHKDPHGSTTHRERATPCLCVSLWATQAPSVGHGLPENQHTPQHW